ncbi:MAG: Coagulation factor 5/8 type domain-containing protein, partial [Baekduiaceae bacterium]
MKIFFSFLGGRFKCGKPWDRYGVAYALPDCSDVHGPQGSAAPFQNFLNYGTPEMPQPTDGWPTLSNWNRTTVGHSHEGLYWKWVERAWLNGERLMVMPVNENRVLCQLQASRSESCDEMTTVRRAVRDLRTLERYVDAQAGGPGKGFFEIVTDPLQARRVINQGRLAVVMEIEISELFGCRGYEEVPTTPCSRADVERGVDEMFDIGIRSMLLLNKFDTPLAGVRFDSGPIGLALINNGNKASSGSFWSARTCEPGELRDNTIETGNPLTGELNDALGLMGVAPGAAPTYPPGPHCNTRGLTQLGAAVVNRMMDKGMIVNPDHMSQRAVDETIRIAETRKYSGVISPHGWMDPGNFPRIWALGGVAFLGGGTVDGHIERWKEYRPKSTPFPIGWGLGTDIGGLFAQAGPSSKAKDVTYPFTSLDGKVKFDKLTVGKRTFDYTQEGIANYGMYADWGEDLRRQAPAAVLRDFQESSEAYLGMWERSVGVPGPACRSSRATLT